MKYGRKFKSIIQKKEQLTYKTIYLIFQLVASPTLSGIFKSSVPYCEWEL